MSGFGVLIAGPWAGFAWHGSGQAPLLVSGGVALVLAGMLAVSGRYWSTN